MANIIILGGGGVGRALLAALLRETLNAHAIRLLDEHDTGMADELRGLKGVDLLAARPAKPTRRRNKSDRKRDRANRWR